MASLSHLPTLLPLLATLFVRVFAFDASIDSDFISPLNCSGQIQTCSASLYHINHNLTIEEIASFYSVNSTRISPITHGNKQDYLITVPCSCRNSSELRGFLYDTSYKVKINDTFEDISQQIYSGQAWLIQDVLVPDEELSIHIVCGCAESSSQIVVTYTVQPIDTVSGIANLLSAELSDMLCLNQILRQNPSFIDLGWVLFVPVQKKGTASP